MNLYLITIKANDSFYIIAESVDIAYNKLLKLLEEKDLYFSSEREFKSAEVIARNYYEREDLFEEEI